MVNEAALERVAAALAAGRGCQLSADDVIAVAKRVWPRLQDQKVVILEDRNAEALAKKAKAEAIIKRVRKIAVEWLRGCSNAKHHWLRVAPRQQASDFVVAALHACRRPEDCLECTAAAMRAVANACEVEAKGKQGETSR